jgi:hypothetical protein
MKRILAVVLIMGVCVLIASSSGLASAAAPDPTTTVAATAVSTETVFPRVIVFNPDGQIDTFFDVPLTSILWPGPGGAVIVTDSKGFMTIITDRGVVWFDAGGNPYGYPCG